MKKMIQQYNIGFESDWMRYLNFIGQLGRRLQSKPREVQNEAARIISYLYRGFLRAGVDPQLTPISEVLSKGDEPLASLADHVTVRENSLRGVPRPAVVTFHDGWGKVAFLLDRGYIIEVTPKIRGSLFMRAMDATGLFPEDFLTGENASGSTKYWIVPPRPHLHFLKSDDLDKVLGALAEQIILKGKKPNLFHLVGAPTVRAAKEIRTTAGYNDAIKNTADKDEDEDQTRGAE